VTLERVGVVGAGTMGAGIAQIAALGGFEVRLHDPVADVLGSAEERIGGALEKGAERGRWSEQEAEAAKGRVEPAADLSGLGGCDLVVEAAPEKLELKRELFAELAKACGDEAILATNTSSLSVTAIAASVPRPERVVGMHFFNPPALMRLVEVVAAPDSSEQALGATAEAAQRMGRTPVRAADEIGFIANRCARPYSLEALRMLADRVADHRTIDTICRTAGGFRMGPFELLDLVGIDVNLSVAKSFWEQSFHEPRWQPNPIQQRMVDSGRLGRKAGRGFYEYGEGAPVPSEEDGPAIEPELERTVLDRIVCQLVNEAAFALQKGIGSAEAIDTAMKLGFNYPKGPLEWGDELGLDHVLAVLDGLREELGEERYRAAPLLRRLVANGERFHH